MISFIQWLPYKVEGEWVSQIAVMGWFLAIALNVLLTIILVFCFMFGALRKTGIPIWLMIINFIFLILQVAVFIVNLPKK